MRMEIEYAGGRVVTVMGSITGRKYVFSGTERVQHVDPRDAPLILRQPEFRFRGVKRGAS
jgi:hypothetical protein